MRGQISLDLMMAVLVTIVVLGTLFAAIGSVKDSYQEIFVENQLKKISSEHAAFITSINALEDVSIDLELRAPVIYYKNRKLSPSLAIDGDMVSASVYLGRTIKHSSQFTRPVGAVIAYDANRTLEVIKVAQ